MKSYNTIIGAMSVLTITTLAAFARGEQTSEEGGALSWQDGESIFLDRLLPIFCAREALGHLLGG